jgi:TPR repeat protein
MAKKSLPVPPTTDNPIVYVRTRAETRTHENENDFLKELLDAQGTEDVDRAAKCVKAALPAIADRKLADAMVAIVHIMATDSRCYPTSFKALLCAAADHGFLDYAYNAANHLMDGAKSVAAYKKAERYYKLAMAYEGHPGTQAAAHVNYCAIVRDGLISGVTDWPAAVEIYETAARMGLVKAMFNAGNVSSWLAFKGDRAYGARAAYWMKYALDFRAAGKPGLDVETSAELENVFVQCMTVLSALHIDAHFDGANLEEGIRWAREAAGKGSHSAQSNLGIGYIHRLMRMRAKPSKSPGGNWRAVLTQLDWRFTGRQRAESVAVPVEAGETIPIKIDWLTVELTDGTTMPLFVANYPCLPAHNGLELINYLAARLAERHPDRFFLLSRKAYFVQTPTGSHTPIHVWHNGRLHRQTLWVESSPELVIQHAQDGVRFLDERYGTWTCMIPIAVNALDEGFVVAADASPDLLWVGVGDPWCLPFVDEENLIELGVFLKTDENQQKRAYILE